MKRSPPEGVLRLVQEGRFVEAARKWEAAGDAAQALDLYGRAQAWGEAARLLTRERRYAEAAAAFMRVLPARMRPGDLDAEQKKTAQNAALCYAKAGDFARAARLFVLIGDRQRAAEALRRAGDDAEAERVLAGTTLAAGGPAAAGAPGVAAIGSGVPPARGLTDLGGAPVATTRPRSQGAGPDPRGLAAGRKLEASGDLEAAIQAYRRDGFGGEAARIALTMGRVEDAAKLYAQGGFPYEAALCWLRLARPANALREWVRVPRDHAQYRDAAVAAIRTATELNALDFDFDRFIVPFVRGPHQPADAASLLALGRLYDHNGHAENAEDAYRAALVADPSSVEAARLLGEVQAQEDRVSPMVYRKIVEEDASFRGAALPPAGGRARGAEARGPRGAGGLPELPELPDLPPLGAPAGPPARPGAASAHGARGTKSFLAPPPPPFVPPGAAAATPGPAPLPAHGAPPSASGPHPSGTQLYGSAPLAAPPSAPLAAPAPASAPLAAPLSAPLGAPVPPQGTVALDPGMYEVLEETDGVPATLPAAHSQPAGRVPVAPPPAPSATRYGVGVSSAPPPAAAPAAPPAAAPPPAPAAPELQAPLGAGSVLAGRYRLESRLGEGGMAAVWRATDLELDEPVAIKVIRQIFEDPQAIERFKRELKLSRQLQHPNIVRVYDFGSWSGLKYITMELMQGHDLAAELSACGGRLPLERGVRLIMQACDGLGVAHALGVVHRDVKPQNLFLVDAGARLKVMDFGIAKATREPGLSQTGMVMGTPEYMAPEQVSGDKGLGPSADLYALGVVLYELFTGATPFPGGELMPLLMAHLTKTPDPPSARNAAIPPELDALILKLLGKKPHHRYADAAETRDALAAVLPYVAGR